MSHACDLFTVAVLDGISKRRYSGSDAAPRMSTDRVRMPPMVIGVEALQIYEALRESAFETASGLTSCLPFRGVFPKGPNGLSSFDPVGWKTQKTFPPVAGQVPCSNKVSDVPRLVVNKGEAVGQELHRIG